MSRHDRAVLKKPDGESLDLQQTEIDAPALPIEQMEKAEKFRPEINTWLMEQTAREAEDRRKRQHRIDTFVFIERLTGQIFGLVIGVVGVGGGAWVALSGEPWAGGSIAGVSIGTLAVAFLRREK